MSEDRKTALYDVHKRMGAKIIPFGGWAMPVEYSGIAREHHAVRTSAGLFDVSHMGEFDVKGPQALDLIQSITSNDASRLVDGQAQYSALPTPDGTVIDDLLVYRRAADHYMLVVNAGNIWSDYDWIQMHNRFDAALTNKSDATSLLAVQGPHAVAILQGLADKPISGLKYYHFTEARILGVPATVSRTGYTGEDGFEIYFPAEESETLWNGILKTGEVTPAGLGARNTLRLEARMLLYGNDIDRTTSLLEAGLGWIVKLDKGEFVGRDALLRQKAEGVRRKLAGFEMFGREIARDHYPVQMDGKEVGHVTSGSPSISLKKNIGLAYLPSEHTAVGTRIAISVRGRACEAQVVPTPFYKRREA